MTQHTSLKVSAVGATHRNVLKRHERIRKMKETDQWQDRKSVYGLPKIKSIKTKVRKAKSEKAEQAEGATTSPQKPEKTEKPAKTEKSNAS